jgi:pimeloyl-ACP methyl ester carboxylesterase
MLGGRRLGLDPRSLQHYDRGVISDVRVAATRDGRTLTFAEWGDPGGFPVFSLHGTPGSRFTRHYDESVYADVGARVITYNRPGYGESERQRGRRVVDCVDDVVAIADTLRIEQFSVNGGSGGGPHALAIAARLPERVRKATCAVGMAPYDAVDFDWFEGMDAFNVRLFGLALQGEDALVPEIEREAAEALERSAADPSRFIGDEVKLSATDRAELARKERHDVMRQSVSEALRNGVWGWVDDDLCFARPWGFDVAEIRVPTRVAYGASDVLVPPRHGEWLASHVPGAEAVISQDRGHMPDAGVVAERFGWLVQPV